MARTIIREEDEGKRVVNADGRRIGIVSGVRGGTAYVDPEPSIADAVMSKLGWENIDEDDYPLKPAAIDTITDDEIRLRRSL